ncbi:MAG: hypothetical protein U5J99_15245 [Parvularculaceae bacterium]|nr:hypothetical protein [Parvularculaceae bacterium]
MSMKREWPGAMIAAVAGIALVSGCEDSAEADSGSKTRKGGLFTKEVVEQPANYYYRITAGYTVKETGENIVFDFVVACGATVTHWRYTGESTRVSIEPLVMIKPTSNGAAVLLRAYRKICEQGVNWGPEKEYGAPLDVLPFVIWFDDARDLSFGWGYATEDAYHNPNSKLKFEGAAVNVSSPAEWKKYREKAASQYVQVGAIPGPWGYSYTHTPKPVNDQVIKRNGGKWITNRCNGYVRIPAPPEVIEKIWKSAPDYNPAPPDSARYFPITGDYKWLRDIFEAAGPVFGGHEVEQYRGNPSLESLGAINRNNSGFIRTHHTADSVIGDHFPMLPLSRSTGHPISTPALSYPQKIIVSDDWKGMLACGGDSGAPGPDKLVILKGDPTPLFDPDWRTKKFPLFINGDLVVENNLDRPYGAGFQQHIFIIDRNGFIFYRAPWGWGGL